MKLVCVIGVIIGCNCCASVLPESFTDKYGRTICESTHIVDPIQEYIDLSPRNKYIKACELIDSSDKLGKIIGARLMIESAIEDGNTSALEQLRIACKVYSGVNLKSKYTKDVLFDMFVEAFED